MAVAVRPGALRGFWEWCLGKRKGHWEGRLGRGGRWYVEGLRGSWGVVVEGFEGGLEGVC